MKKLIALFFTLSACGGTPAKDSVAAHSVDASAQAGAQSVTHTAGGQLVVISGQAKDCFVLARNEAYLRLTCEPSTQPRTLAWWGTTQSGYAEHDRTLSCTRELE